jgi:dTDP-4-dehydrorhamnose 3,5-epimerase
MSRFSILATPFDGVHVLQRQCLGDTRGFLSRLFCAHELSLLGWHEPIAQINHTRTQKAGTVRGMHFQYPPATERKLVTCLKGEILDVVVDVREGSPTQFQHFAYLLSADKACSMLVAPGFAHGFQSLTDDCELVYCHSAMYHAELEGGINALDPALAIPWLVPVSEISLRDQQHLGRNQGFRGLVL